MAGNIPAIYLLKLRLFLCTPFRRIRTTGTEAAAGQRFCIEILFFCNLADIPEEHHADSIRNEIDHGQIMPDEQVGKTVLLL